MWGDETEEGHLPFMDYDAPIPGQDPFQPQSSATVAPANAAQRAVEDLQNEIILSAKRTADKASFAEHIRDIEQGTGKLFPGNTVLGEGEPAEIPGQEQGTPVPTIPPTTAKPNTSVEHEWFDHVATAINQLAEEQEKLRKLIIHSICQSNMLGTCHRGRPLVGFPWSKPSTQTTMRLAIRHGSRRTRTLDRASRPHRASRGGQLE